MTFGVNVKNQIGSFGRVLPWSGLVDSRFGAEFPSESARPLDLAHRRSDMRERLMRAGRWMRIAGRHPECGALSAFGQTRNMSEQTNSEPDGHGRVVVVGPDGGAVETRSEER